MGDFFWNIATSYAALSAIGLVLAAALVVGYFPLLKWFPVIGTYVPVARLVVLLSAGLLFFLVGFKVSDGRAEAKSLRAQLAAKQVDLDATQQAANAADKAREELAEQAKQDQERIADYAEKLKKRPNGACTLVPDDFGGVRNNPGRGTR